MPAIPTKRAPKAPPTEQQLWDYAIRVVSARAISAGQMRTKLRGRRAAPDAVDAVMAKLQEYKYLNDEAYAAAYASARKENQGHGRERVLRDLRLKKVPAKLAETAVESTYAESNETELIEAFIARKIRKPNLAEYLADPSNLNSAFRRLRYAGFSAANSIKVLRRFSQHAEELEAEEE